MSGARNRGYAILALAMALAVALPLAGAALAGLPLSPYLHFPPRPTPDGLTPFSWPVFLVLGALVLGALGALARAILRTPPAPRVAVPRRRFPLWGWLGTAWTAAAWVVAWNRFPAFAPWQPHTFAPLWLGYIAVINAWTYRRTGSCLACARPRYFLALFPFSAGFWWFFEYLNAYVHNWYYAGIAGFGPGAYFAFATAAYATVLPAVLSTREWLASFPALGGRLARLAPVTVRHGRALAWGVLLAAGAGLGAIGVFPDQLYPLLWIAPLLLVTALQALAGETTVFAGLRHGDWRGVVLPALAALICGLFWEMWNFKSLAHWQYRVPYVQRFELFYMPLLGYAGYLPFGLECAVIGEVLGRRLRRGPRAARPRR